MFAFDGAEAEMVFIHPVVDYINIILEDIKVLRAAHLSDLSWSHHIDSIYTKARKILGFLYQRFSHDTELYALLQLNLSLVRPVLSMGVRFGIHIFKNT